MTVVEFLLARLAEDEASALPGILGWLKRRDARYRRQWVDLYRTDPHQRNEMPTVIVRALIHRYRTSPGWRSEWLSL